MTSEEASAIIRSILMDKTRLWRSAHFHKRLEARGYTIADVWKLLRTHTLEGNPKPNRGRGNHEVRLRGRCLDGRDTRLVLGISETGPCIAISIIDIKGRGKKRS